MLDHVDYDSGDFNKYVDGLDVFMCPADNPHPSRISLDKWDIGYPFSYGISAALSQRKWQIFAKDASGQVLTADGMMMWILNMSGWYVDDPTIDGDYPSGCNDIGYFHGGGKRANVVCRDNSARTVKWGRAGKSIDTTKTFLFYPGEDVNEGYNYQNKTYYVIEHPW